MPQSGLSHKKLLACCEEDGRGSSKMTHYKQRQD